MIYEDWFGNDQADDQAKKGAAKHNYTEEQKRAVRDKVTLAKRAQEHMMKTYVKYINRPEVKEYSLKNKKIKGSPTGKRGRNNITSKDNGHIVQTNGTYEYCVLCGSSIKATHTNTNKQDGKTEFWRRRICKPNDRMIKYKENHHDMGFEAWWKCKNCETTGPDLNKRKCPRYINEAEDQEQGPRPRKRRKLTEGKDLNKDNKELDDNKDDKQHQ